MCTSTTSKLPLFVKPFEIQRRTLKTQIFVPNAKEKKVGFGKKKDPIWKCVEGCGACCKLAKGSAFPTPEEIFTKSSDIELFRSLLGEDGWCIHYQKSTRTCSIYKDRPYFCRVEPEVFQELYGIERRKFNRIACSSCVDTIKSVYGSSSMELENFQKATRRNAS